MNMASKKLTVVIPTYNRKKPLLRMLDSLRRQGQFDKYKILIMDNHSDYDVKQTIDENFDGEFRDIIVVHSWKFNTSQAFNMTAGMPFVDTEWCWLISDDDAFTEHAIERGLEDMEKHPDVAVIRYSLNCYKHDDVLVNNLTEFIGYYKTHASLKCGETFYIGGLFNMRVLQPYLTYATRYSYTYIAFVVPFLKALEDSHAPLLFSSFQAYDYFIAEEVGWYKKPSSYLTVMLGIRTFRDIPFNISAKQKNELCAIMTSAILRDTKAFSVLSLIEDRHARIENYRQLKYAINYKWWHKPILKTIFYIQYYTGVNCLKPFIKG